MLYDCIVVGAGPAGSTAAKILAKFNKRVLIIDSKNFPREKLCGGCLSAKIIHYLPNIKEISHSSAKVSLLTYKNVACISLEAKEPFAYFVNRKSFDNLLLNEALSCGCDFSKEKFLNFERFPDYIKIYTDMHTYKAKYLLGADGANSRLRKALAISPKYIVNTIQGEIIENHTAFNEIVIDVGSRSSEYSWFFPQNHVFGIASRKKYINKLFNSYNEFKIQNVKGYFIPIAFSKRNLGFENILLLGDAACLADPFSLEGIYQAIHSAHMAALAIIHSPVNPFKIYSTLMSDILTQNKYAYYIRKILKFTPYLAFSRLSATTNNDALVDYLSGKKNSKKVLELLIKCFISK